MIRRSWPVEVAERHGYHSVSLRSWSEWAAYLYFILGRRPQPKGAAEAEKLVFDTLFDVSVSVIREFACRRRGRRSFHFEAVKIQARLASR